MITPSPTESNEFPHMGNSKVVAKDCESLQKDKTLKKSNCTGYEIAVHTVWTELQCLDNCFRHPHCLKYIFYGKGSQNCKLVNTGDIDNITAKNLLKITGACAPDNVKERRGEERRGEERRGEERRGEERRGEERRGEERRGEERRREDWCMCTRQC
ncbi:hypothetical protein ACROYT_G033890 [Oculina patagonica]